MEVGYMQNKRNKDVCPQCDQYPYSDIDRMCPVCGNDIDKLRSKNDRKYE
jgi:ribosomal protein L37E